MPCQGTQFRRSPGTALWTDIGSPFFAGAVAFQLVTLPVESNASRQALVELDRGLVYLRDITGGRKVLSAAALTHAAAAAASHLIDC